MVVNTLSSQGCGGGGGASCVTTPTVQTSMLGYLEAPEGSSGHVSVWTCPESVMDADGGENEDEELHTCEDGASLTF